MRFAVERVSEYRDDVAPCSEALRDEIEVWDVRTFKSPEEHDEIIVNDAPWLSRGTDHGLVLGPRGGVQGIKRRMGTETAWFVEIEDLDALMVFYEEHGDLIITTNWNDHETPTIDIYDDYRE